MKKTFIILFALIQFILIFFQNTFYYSLFKSFDFFKTFFSYLMNLNFVLNDYNLNTSIVYIDLIFYSISLFVGLVLFFYIVKQDLLNKILKSIFVILLFFYLSLFSFSFIHSCYLISHYEQENQIENYKENNNYIVLNNDFIISKKNINVSFKNNIFYFDSIISLKVLNDTEFNNLKINGINVSNIKKDSFIFKKYNAYSLDYKTKSSYNLFYFIHINEKYYIFDCSDFKKNQRFFKNILINNIFIK